MSLNLRHDTVNVTDIVTRPVFGVVGVYFFGYKTNTIRDEENWGTLPQAMLTLFGFVTVCLYQSV